MKCTRHRVQDTNESSQAGQQYVMWLECCSCTAVTTVVTFGFVFLKLPWYCPPPILASSASFFCSASASGFFDRIFLATPDIISSVLLVDRFGAEKRWIHLFCSPWCSEQQGTGFFYCSVSSVEHTSTDLRPNQREQTVPCAPPPLTQSWRFLMG